MDYLRVDKNNIDHEHICCAIADKKGENYVSSKKEWMKSRFEEGLVFLKANVRGKVFIEYIPAEMAWVPIIADNYMFINCFWVSGKYKGHGYANELLNKCIEDSREKGKSGLVVLSSTKKIPFLSDPKYLKYKGFKVADRANPYYELLYYSFDDDNKVPIFKEQVKKGEIHDKGIVLYYTNQCPHTDKYAPMIKRIAEDRGVPVKLIKIEDLEQAQNAPSPFTTYSFFYDGKFVTNEIFGEKEFLKFLDKIELRSINS